jgi:anti-anti-sigma regulatory factor
MTHKSYHVSQETYHRIYWFAKRNVAAEVIAHTLKLPLKTVQHIIERFSSTDHADPVHHTPEPIIPAQQNNPADGSASGSDEDFLDVFLFIKTRYAIMDISGMVTKKNIYKLNTEIHKLENSDLKAVALRLTDVKDIDSEGLSAIVALHGTFKKAGRYTAILDPSPMADDFILSLGVEKKIPVYGTETAFEAHAFR